MAYVFVEDFKSGLDRRKEQVAGTPGSLWELVNAHITRGGAIERRKKFVSTYSLPSGTYGFHTIGGALYVFGSGTDPGVPVGVTYQRLQHPDGSTAMSKLLFSESFDGGIYAIAEYSDSNRYHFYSGTIVADWIDGIVRTDMTDNDGIADHLKDLIDADADFGATRSGSVVTVTGATNVEFTTDSSTSNLSGGTDDQTLVVAETQASVDDVTEVLATTSFDITAGTANTAATGTVTLTGGASGSVDGITVDGVEVMSGAESFASDLDTTATAVAANITANTSSPDYSATAAGAIITISAAVAVGADANTFAVVSSSTTITTSDANMASGVTNAVTSITVDGVEILSTRVNWAISSSGFATNIATQIDSYVSSPEYNGSSTGSTVVLEAASASGTSANGLVITITTVGDVTVSTPASMSGGVDAVTGQPQKNTVTVGGTFEVGDSFNVELGGNNFGYIGNPSTVGKTALTFKSKIYSTVDELIHFCGVDAPTVWDRDNLTEPGAGFINLSSQDEGSETLYVAQAYQGNLAIFARSTIQIWSVDADDDNNTFLQTVQNTGTRSAKSVESYGNNDVFYLADSGVRSIRARDSSNTASVSDVGTPIDPLITAYLGTLTDAQIEDAVAVLEPVDDRYWLAVGTRLFVFSFFPGSKISAWSYYDLTDDIGAAISDFVRINDQVYARSGDTIYLYGGAAGTTYPDDDEIDVTVELPFLTGGTPGTVKNLEGFDAALTGTWSVVIQVDPTNTAATVSVGSIGETTYPTKRAVVQTPTTHFAPKLTCSKAGAATLSNLVVHYEDPNEAG
jgi:hypothetical protein